MNRLPGIQVENLDRSERFYRELLGLEAPFRAAFLASMRDPENPALALILQPRTHQPVPEGFRAKPRRAPLAFVVADCDALMAGTTDTMAGGESKHGICQSG